MEGQIFVRPSQGIKLREPERRQRYLPDAGAWVPDNEFWRRRLKDGDVVRATPQARPPAPPTAPPPAEKE